MLDVVGLKYVPFRVAHELLGLLYDLQHLALQIREQQVLNLAVQFGQPDTLCEGGQQLSILLKYRHCIIIS